MSCTFFNHEHGALPIDPPTNVRVRLKSRLAISSLVASFAKDRVRMAKLLAAFVDMRANEILSLKWDGQVYRAQVQASVTLIAPNRNALKAFRLCRRRHGTVAPAC